MRVSLEVYTELVSLMLSGYDIATSRFRQLRSEHYIATTWYFYKKILKLWSSYYPSYLTYFQFSYCPWLSEAFVRIKGLNGIPMNWQWLQPMHQTCVLQTLLISRSQ